MSSLLTRDEYQALARTLVLPSGAFVDGKHTAAISGKSFGTVNPATGSQLNEIAACDGAPLIATRLPRDDNETSSSCSILARLRSNSP